MRKLILAPKENAATNIKNKKTTVKFVKFLKENAAILYVEKIGLPWQLQLVASIMRLLSGHTPCQQKSLISNNFFRFHCSIIAKSNIKSWNLDRKLTYKLKDSKLGRMVKLNLITPRNVSDKNVWSSFGHDCTTKKYNTFNYSLLLVWSFC